ncbi:MAG: DUF3545 family protein [Pseudomonadota bacterium]|uniref:DUF3545 family protein n=1 Tax=Alteromonas oceani TaxID=2071609 RepID=A0ABV7K3F2_9ALTE|nr:MULTISPECIES: DUF3545 family protein [Alteromonas]MBR9790626.1 DUF3545 family protein [Gammaproteobacteria bacterium]MCP4865100.1 DUF3545 family protein [Alteromonas sp.]MDG6098328.1 DUF3545 family protein [Alteromonas sp. ZYF713]MDY6925486.1 DUF3545 family protein [Pseudomonadota bacterium]GGF74076.1 hypothetical protein GCM10011338_27630 [Alteromonas lipolytica]
MDTSDLFAMLNLDETSTKTKSKKRKWREIEAIKDRYQLEKELADIDMSFDLALEESAR